MTKLNLIAAAAALALVGGTAAFAAPGDPAMLTAQDQATFKACKAMTLEMALKDAKCVAVLKKWEGTMKPKPMNADPMAADGMMKKQ